MVLNRLRIVAAIVAFTSVACVLKPDTTYFALSDSGWITLGSKRAIGLNDGAFWYRFRTAKQ